MVVFSDVPAPLYASTHARVCLCDDLERVTEHLRFSWATTLKAAARTWGGLCLCFELVVTLASLSCLPSLWHFYPVCAAGPHHLYVTKAKLRLREASRPMATQASGCRRKRWPETHFPHPELLPLPSVSSTQSPGAQAPNLMWLLRINQLIRCSRACLSFLRTWYNKVGLISPAPILREQVN